MLVRHYRRNLDDQVAIRIEPRHFEVYPDEIVPLLEQSAFHGAIVAGSARGVSVNEYGFAP